MTTSVGSAVQQVVSGTTALPVSSPGSPAPSNNTTLAGNFQTFLTLLTTQLQNQKIRSIRWIPTSSLNSSSSSRASSSN
jgi:hypothetical protein